MKFELNIMAVATYFNKLNLVLNTLRTEILGIHIHQNTIDEVTCNVGKTTLVTSKESCFLGH